MKRTKFSNSQQPLRLAVKTQIVSELLSRSGLARQLGWQYGDKRKVYKALGYPDEKDLTFEYFYNKYDRQDISRAVIDRPCDATWRGIITISEPGSSIPDSQLNKAWLKLNKDLKLKMRLNKADKLCDLGRYSLVFFGFDDVKDDKGFARPVSGGNKKLLYIKQIAESEGDVHTWERNPQHPRYGLPVLYRIRTGTVMTVGSTTVTTGEHKDIIVHHTRVLHLVSGNLTSEVFGVSKLKPIINRLVDLEKILGGDAEMFWRGARPGYTATEKEGYEIGPTEEALLMDELDKYEHDLRRFLVLKGIDVKALEQQVADPLHHIDGQLQAISAQTGIPKRILIGSERGELASTQDKDQWKELIKTRQEEHAEPSILRPFIDKLMEHGILPKVEDYVIGWEDSFAPSDRHKAEVGKMRADAITAYSNSALASVLLSPELALKYLLGLSEEQVKEAMQKMEEQFSDEDSLYNRVKEEEEEAMKAAERERAKAKPQPQKTE